MKTQPLLISALISLCGSVSLANEVELPFAKTWETITKNSASINAAQNEADAAQAASDRGDRHWLPRLYIDAKYYQTNDPGAVFFGIMEQRALTNTDFNPDSINEPDAQSFTRAALGIDLPIYEGGAKHAESKVLNQMAEAKKWETEQTRNATYGQVLQSYGTVLIVTEQKNALQDLTNLTDRVLKNYQVGSKSNPVGYSGLLGLKSLSNRLKGLSSQYDSLLVANRAALKEMGLTDPVNWRPVKMSTVDLVANASGKMGTGPSHQLKSLQLQAASAQDMSKAELARHLPRVGAFAETYTFDGDRDQADGYTAGLYLQWNLFNPNDFGRRREAQLKARAAESFARAMGQNENATRAGLDAASQSLQQNLNLLSDSDKLTIEQLRVAESLFRNGAINALQFVEVLSRRADLIAHKTDAEIQYLKITSEKMQKNEFIVSNETSQGGQK
jgi:outer membrane protein TolC